MAEERLRKVPIGHTIYLSGTAYTVTPDRIDTKRGEHLVGLLPKKGQEIFCPEETQIVTEEDFS